MEYYNENKDARMNKSILKNFEEAKKKTVNIFAAKRTCEKDLCDKLQRGGFDNDTIADVVEWAKDYHLLDDAEYARIYIADARNIKKHGRRKIEYDLRMRGIDAELIADLLCGTDFDERGTLRPLIEKKLAGDLSPKNRAKVFRYFANKGYSFDDINDVIRNINFTEE